MSDSKYSEKDIQRFWSKVAITDNPDDCWLWTAGTVTGYGSFGFQGRMRIASRVAWEITNSEIPAGMKVLHTCDNPLCVNPKHLFLGTQLDNMRDMVRKGRKVQPGEAWYRTHPRNSK